jgi:excinuclease ABC subunit B
MVVEIRKGQKISRDFILSGLVKIQYKRNDVVLDRGTFRVRGDVIEIHPAYLDYGIRVELFGDEVEKITEFNILTGAVTVRTEYEIVFPATHFVVPKEKMKQAIDSIKAELAGRSQELESQQKFLELQRIQQRTNFDVEMMQEIGYCQGIENYSRHISGRNPGERPYCLLDFFPKDYLMVIDESHVSIPQLNGMYNGDHSRKKTLVDFGFRLPSAMDNRPLKFEEFEQLVPQLIYVSATPREYELKRSNPDYSRDSGEVLYPGVVEQVIRPTGLVDPEVEIRPIKGQVKNLIKEIKLRVRKKERILVTTLTKRMAEDLASFLTDEGVKAKYLHSEIKTLERIDIITELRKGEFDCLVGVNLLREGLDLPEVTLVAILDADKEGFLRSETSLIQVCGRAARNVEGKVIMYADNITGSMDRAIKEMNRRRKKQQEYNRKQSITPKTIIKEVKEFEELTSRMKRKSYELVRETGYSYDAGINVSQIVEDLKKQMKDAADNLDFELAAILRDRVFELEKRKR